jgi:RecJ-like exonuclease
MAKFFKISRQAGVWEIVAECEACEGETMIEVDAIVCDYDRGGYIDSKWADCPQCDGRGWRHITEEEEEELSE